MLMFVVLKLFLLHLTSKDITSALECLQTLASVQLTAKIFTENIGVLTECIDTIKKVGLKFPIGCFLFYVCMAYFGL